MSITSRLDDLRRLHDGWLDGRGYAPSHEGLVWLRQAAHVLRDSPVPYIYPTPEGGVQLEWDIGQFRPSLTINLDTKIGEWHCLDLDAGESHEKVLNLNSIQGWRQIVDQLLLLHRITTRISDLKF